MPTCTTIRWDFRARYTSRGFSTVELLIAIAILGILTSLAAPSFFSAIERYRVNAIRDELIGNIQLARIESIRRGAQVSMIRTTGCATTLTDSDDWSCGYQLFVDTNANGALNTGETVIQSSVIPSGYALMHPSQGSTLRMNIWGQAQNTGNRFVITPPSGVSSASIKTICLSTGGRIRTIAESATC